MDEEIYQLGRYLGKYQTYIDFKQDHPYAGSHPDFEQEVTPVTVLDHDANSMKCYLPDEQSKSAHILTKFKTVAQLQRRHQARMAAKKKA